MFRNCNDLLTNLNATISFCGGSGNRVRVASFSAYRYVIGIVNTYFTASHCVIPSSNPCDPQGI